jgi:hypothetical protein
MSESDELRLGRIAISRIFRDESKLKLFLKVTQDLRINLETCDFRQVESYVRELSPPAGAIPARGGRAVVSYQDLPDNELEVLQQHFRQEVKEAKVKHHDLFR